MKFSLIALSALATFAIAAPNDASPLEKRTSLCKYYSDKYNDCKKDAYPKKYEYDECKDEEHKYKYEYEKCAKNKGEHKCYNEKKKYEGKYKECKEDYEDYEEENEKCDKYKEKKYKYCKK